MPYAIRSRSGDLRLLQEAVATGDAGHRASDWSWYLALGCLGPRTKSVLALRYGLYGRPVRSAREVASHIQARTVREVYSTQYAGIRALRRALRVPDHERAAAEI